MRPLRHARTALWLTAGAALFSISCGPPPRSAQETLPQLKAALHEPVSTPEQNKQNSELAVEVSEHLHLQGMTRLTLEEKLGKGSPCGKHPICRERGFFDDDWYYEIGTEGTQYLRHRPALIVGFNRFGKVERTFVLEVR